MPETHITLRSNGARLSCDTTHASLLDVLETHHVKVEFQCRAGYCGSCRLRLLKGRVIYRQTPLALIRAGEILPCCCLPTEDIELEL